MTTPLISLDKLVWMLTILTCTRPALAAADGTNLLSSWTKEDRVYLLELFEAAASEHAGDIETQVLAATTSMDHALMIFNQNLNLTTQHIAQFNLISCGVINLATTLYSYGYSNLIHYKPITIVIFTFILGMTTLAICTV